MRRWFDVHDLTPGGVGAAALVISRVRAGPVQDPVAPYPRWFGVVRDYAVVVLAYDPVLYEGGFYPGARDRKERDPVDRRLGGLNPRKGGVPRVRDGEGLYVGVRPIVRGLEIRQAHVRGYG